MDHTGEAGTLKNMCSSYFKSPNLRCSVKHSPYLSSILPLSRGQTPTLQPGPWQQTSASPWTLAKPGCSSTNRMARAGAEG